MAVIDTGIDLDHPDLNVVHGRRRNCSTGDSADDGNGHGTHVAGTIGAIDNGDRRRRSRPGRPASGRCACSTTRAPAPVASIICGIDCVTAHAGEIEVANMSLGGAGTDDRNCGLSNNDALHQAICGPWRRA